MNSILQDIIESKAKGNKLLAILLDPEKIAIENLALISAKINQSPTTHIFIGGSSEHNHQTDEIVAQLKMYVALPIVLFPGNPSQITNNADAILYLSLLSGRNPDFLIENQIKAVSILKKTNLEVISTSYILVNSGEPTSVSTHSKTKALHPKNPEIIVQTAQAGEYLGHKLLYLEAGSGAKNRISDSLISLVSQNVIIPLIVGGGICTLPEIQNVFKAGADLVVIGTAFERNLNFFNS